MHGDKSPSNVKNILQFLHRQELHHILMLAAIFQKQRLNKAAYKMALCVLGYLVLKNSSAALEHYYRFYFVRHKCDEIPWNHLHTHGHFGYTFNTMTVSSFKFSLNTFTQLLCGRIDSTHTTVAHTYI